MRSYTTHVPFLHQKAITFVVSVLGALLLFPVSTFAASFSFSPSSGTYTVGSTFSVGVYVGSRDRAMNAASGIVSFSQDLLEVTSISKNQSIVSLWVQEPSFSNSAGTVNYEGIVLNPGYTGAQGKIVTINFRVKAEGTASVSFSSGSVLANDGSGTEILNSKGSARFVLSPKPVAEPAVVSDPPLALPTSPAPRVDSASHKDGLWSNSTTGTFNFDVPQGVIAMRLLLDDIPTSIPTVVYEPPLSAREIKDIKEGTSYLHVQYKTDEGWGAVTHVKLQVDTVPPTNLVVTNTDISGVTTDIVTFTFASEDVHSGITRYEVVIDGSEPVSLVGGGVVTFTTPKGLVAGLHTMVVRAFDVAGNEVSTSTQFVTADPLPVKTQDEPKNSIEQTSFFKTGTAAITILSIVIPFVALVLLLVTLLFMIWRAYGGLRKRIRKEVLEAKMVVHKAFALLRDDLQDDIKTLEKASKKRKLTREEAKILKRLRQNIDEAEKVISDEMLDIEEVV